MEYVCLIDKLPKYYEKMARTDFTTVFSNIWWALRGPDVCTFENHKWVYTIPIRVAMFGVTGGRFSINNLCLSLETYEDFIEEVLTLKEPHYIVEDAMEHYLEHIRVALMYLKELFKGTEAEKVFNILFNAVCDELEFMNTGSFRALRDMTKELKKIIIMCRNCIHAEPTDDPFYVYCKKNRAKPELHYWCQHFKPRLD